MSHDAYKANLLRMRASNQKDSGNLAAALKSADEAIAYAAASLPPLTTPPNIDAQALFDWAVALEIRGIIHRHLRNLPDSLQDLDHAEQALRKILPQFPMRENYAALAQILHNRCNTRLLVPDPERAGRDATEAIAIRRRIAPGDAEESDLLAGTLKTRANVFLLARQPALAVRDAEEAVTIRRNALPPHPDAQHQHVFGMTLFTLGQAQAAAGNRTEACASVREASGILEKVPAGYGHVAIKHDLAMCTALQQQVCSPLTSVAGRRFRFWRRRP